MNWWAFILGVVLGYEGRFLIQRAVAKLYRKFDQWADDGRTS